MTFDEFQQASSRTLYKGPFDKQMLLFALGLTTEAGEVGDLVKKWARLGPDAVLNVPAISEEIGDLLWYAAALASTVGLNLDEIAEQNIEKLWERYPDGLAPERDCRHA